MSTLPLTYAPNPLLRQTLTLVRAEDLKRGVHRDLLAAMADTMIASRGVGIAANQVGTNLSLCIIATKAGPLALANPTILRASIADLRFRRTHAEEEGCLSIPGVFGLVPRRTRIRVRALNSMGEATEFIAEDFFARVIQHEIDHLNGILFVDRATKMTRGERPGYAR